jgi:uncharacterized protein YjiS (DUF1127 family)
MYSRNNRNATVFLYIQSIQLDRIMREYTLHDARSRQAYGRLTGLVRLLKNWKTRNDLKRLLAMDDFMLRDIGLTRDELQRLARQSLRADWQWQSERQDR